MKSQREAPTPEREVRKCNRKRSEKVRMDINEQEKRVNDYLLASSN